MYQLFIRLHYRKKFLKHWKRYKYIFDKTPGYIKKTRLSEEFIRQFPHLVDIRYISRTQILTEEVIREFKDPVYMVLKLSYKIF